MVWMMTMLPPWLMKNTLNCHPSLAVMRVARTKFVLQSGGSVFLTLGNPTNSRFRARNSPREGLQFSSSMICCEAATIRRSSGIQPSLLQRPRKILPAHQHESLVFQELPELRAANHIEITLSPGGSPI